MFFSFSHFPISPIYFDKNMNLEGKEMVNDDGWAFGPWEDRGIGEIQVEIFNSFVWGKYLYQIFIVYKYILSLRVPYFCQNFTKSKEPNNSDCLKIKNWRII